MSEEEKMEGRGEEESGEVLGSVGELGWQIGRGLVCWVKFWECGRS